MHLSMFSHSSFNQYSVQYSFMPLAAFPHNHCQNNGQWWERNESCRIDWHQSLERILAEQGIKPVTSCSQVCYATDWAMELGIFLLVLKILASNLNKLLTYRNFKRATKGRLLAKCFSGVIHIVLHRIVTHYKALHPFPHNNTFWRPWKTSLLKTLGKGEIARNEQFLLFPQCFLPVWITFCHFLQIWNCCLQTFLVWKSLIFVVW